MVRKIVCTCFIECFKNQINFLTISSTSLIHFVNFSSRIIQIFVLGREILIMKVKVIKKKKEEVEQEEKEEVKVDSDQDYIG